MQLRVDSIDQIGKIGLLECDALGEAQNDFAAVDDLRLMMRVHDSRDCEQPSPFRTAGIVGVKGTECPRESFRSQVRNSLWIGRSSSEERANDANLVSIHRLEPRGNLALTGWHNPDLRCLGTHFS